MKWITREKVKVDRVACPWLIKKFVDPEAEFLFVTTQSDKLSNEFVNAARKSFLLRRLLSACEITLRHAGAPLASAMWETP